MEEVQQSPAGQGGAAACQLHQVKLSTRALTFFFSEVFCTDYFVRSSDRSILVDLRKKNRFYSLSRGTI